MEFSAKGGAQGARRLASEITINKIADKVELMCGLERKSRTIPRRSLFVNPVGGAARPTAAGAPAISGKQAS